MSSFLFHSPPIVTPFPPGGHRTDRSVDARAVMGVQGVFPLAQKLGDASDLKANGLAFAPGELLCGVGFVSGLPIGRARSPQSDPLGEFDTGQNDEWRSVQGVQGHSPDTPFSPQEKKKSVFFFFYPDAAGDGRDL